MGMDRKITLRWYQKRRNWWTIASLGAAILLIVLILSIDTESRFRVQRERLTISEVHRGPFQEFVAVTASVLPIRTVYLDAIEGGRVERIVSEAGNLISAGDTILVLSNSFLQLDIMNREAQLFEQRNNLRNTRLAMEQNGLRLEAQRLDLDRQISTTKRLHERNLQLVHKSLISQDDFEETRDQYEYLIKKRDLTIRSQQQDSVFREIQIDLLETSVARIEGNLAAVRENLGNLCLKAPVAGQLTALNADLGESKSRGERLGQIDIMDGFKLRADVDEHYIGRLEIGRTARCTLNGQNYSLRITKVFPEVRDGRFQIDLVFADSAPANIRRGQSLHVQLELGDQTDCLQLARGAFYETSAGRWVYVLDQSGRLATKREIRLGKQNPDTFEVLEGLAAGEMVVTSSYEHYGETERLVLQD